MKYFFGVVFLLSTCVASAQDITPYDRFLPPVKVVIVSIQQPWDSTGIQVNPGDTINIIMTGIASTMGGTTANSIYWLGPEGNGSDVPNSAHPMPNVAGQSVIGKIGTNGNPFYVGRNCIFTSNVSGQLYLGLNDNQFYDNYGYYIAFITGSNRSVFGSATAYKKASTPPTNFSVSQNYPNPFNPSTTIDYSVPAISNVQINIYDASGRLIRSLLNDTENAGGHSVSWNGKDNSNKTVASGVYFYQVEIGNFVQAKKMLLLK